MYFCNFDTKQLLFLLCSIFLWYWNENFLFIHFVVCMSHGRYQCFAFVCMYLSFIVFPLSILQISCILDFSQIKHAHVPCLLIPHILLCISLHDHNYCCWLTYCILLKKLLFMLTSNISYIIMMHDEDFNDILYNNILAKKLAHIIQFSNQNFCYY